MKLSIQLGYFASFFHAYGCSKETGQQELTGVRHMNSEKSFPCLTNIVTGKEN